jgi:hypothetical protein
MAIAKPSSPRGLQADFSPRLIGADGGDFFVGKVPGFFKDSQVGRVFWPLSATALN